MTDHDKESARDCASPSARPSLYDQKRHERTEAIFARVKAEIESRRDSDDPEGVDDAQPDWLDLTDGHTEEQWVVAYEKVLRDNEPTEEPGDPPLRAGSIVTCPLDSGCRRLDVFAPVRRYDRIPPEATTRVLVARRTTAKRQNPRTLDLVWEVALTEPRQLRQDRAKALTDALQGLVQEEIRVDMPGADEEAIQLARQIIRALNSSQWRTFENHVHGASFPPGVQVVVREKGGPSKLASALLRGLQDAGLAPASGFDASQTETVRVVMGPKPMAQPK